METAPESEVTLVAFLIIALGIIIFAVTKWHRGRDRPLDPDLFDSPEKKARREKFKKGVKGVFKPSKSINPNPW